MDFGPMQSEALTLKYIPQLIRLKTFLQKQYGIGVLENIDKYPLDLDKSLVSFYEKILFVLSHSAPDSMQMTRNQYFVKKRSMKYINGHIFYEYVFDVVNGKYEVELLTVEKNIPSGQLANLLGRGSDDRYSIAARERRFIEVSNGKIIIMSGDIKKGRLLCGIKIRRIL